MIMFINMAYLMWLLIGCYFDDSQSKAMFKNPCVMNVNSDVLTCLYCWRQAYRKTSNIRRTLVGKKIVDFSDVVGAAPVGAAPTTSSFST